MNNTFEESLYDELNYNPVRKGVIKASKAQIAGKTKITVEEEAHNGVKIIVKKDSSDSVKEIKFVCSCGQTKSIILDYSE